MEGKKAKRNDAAQWDRRLNHLNHNSNWPHFFGGVNANRSGI